MVHLFLSRVHTYRKTIISNGYPRTGCQPERAVSTHHPPSGICDPTHTTASFSGLRSMKPALTKEASHKAAGPFSYWWQLVLFLLYVPNSLSPNWTVIWVPDFLATTSLFRSTALLCAENRLVTAILTPCGPHIAGMVFRPSQTCPERIQDPVVSCKFKHMEHRKREHMPP